MARLRCAACLCVFLNRNLGCAQLNWAYFARSKTRKPRISVKYGDTRMYVHTNYTRQLVTSHTQTLPYALEIHTQTHTRARSALDSTITMNQAHGAHWRAHTHARTRRHRSSCERNLKCVYGFEFSLFVSERASSSAKRARLISFAPPAAYACTTNLLIVHISHKRVRVGRERGFFM